MGRWRVFHPLIHSPSLNPEVPLKKKPHLNFKIWSAHNLIFKFAFLISRFPWRSRLGYRGACHSEMLPGCISRNCSGLDSGI